ncbi:MAG: ABC transporter substrate-binding protein [Rhodospirillales bacterium]|jgi:NitT/TauT family transport system substrate-binding protein|nr:ABC transporter substrate-binding protein [Rhodospirillales bacterium]MBT4038873.1 ABC transporter substrate-binding protein [Rhodospirillales bacterium]MBT4626183.1 ABC transporter substrate-binding protein [Rhodospirillales bacterium]MBT5350568.1 ABC transporter substrate-binding protein [Rhodospirillales bacterium]MBT6109062.1 ABC transporter substrate-binding protein [Rhodospirillales bacterium]
MTSEVSKKVARTLSRFCIGAVLLMALTIGTIGTAVAKEKVRVGHFTWPGYGFLYVAQEKNLAPDLEFEFTIIEDPIQLFSLLSSGQLDVVFSTVEFGPIATAEDMGFKLISFTNLSNGTDNIVVRPDIKEASDLIGQQIAILEGGLSQIMVAIWLEENGVSVDDVQMVNLIAGDAAAAMTSGQIAAAELWDPFGAQVLADLPGARSVSNSREDYWTKTGLIGDAIFMSDTFTIKHRDTAVKTTKAIFDAVEYWRANPVEAGKIIGDAIGFSEEDVASILVPTEDNGIYMYGLEQAGRFCGVLPGEAPFGQPNGQAEANWNTTNDWWIKFGFMTKKVDFKEGTDCALLKEAYEAN